MNVKTTKSLGKLIALSLITSTVLHATNGDNLIATGVKARGMGGVGIAVSHGAESGLANAALITSVESTEITFGGTIFMPDIETSLNMNPQAQLPAQNSYTSDADLSMIPEVSIATKIDENWYVGIGMWGTAGMGTDYSGNSDFAVYNFGNMDMVTNLQLMQFGVPIAYKTGGLSLAITPIVQYGNLDINYHMPEYDPDTGALVNVNNIGAGIAQDFGFGWNLGIAYDFAENGVEGLTLGAVYKSSIEMDYDNQLTTAVGAMGLSLPHGDTLEQPEEYGVGIAYVMGQHTFGFDYKKIKWSDAKGYGDFGWDDSNVYAFGYAYAENEWTIRLGYNHADSAVVQIPGGDSNYGAAALNFFNLLGFPATAEDHYTIGASYAFSNSFSLDLAYVYADETSDTFSTAGLMMGIDSVTTSHSEDSISFQLAYKF